MRSARSALSEAGPLPGATSTSPGGAGPLAHGTGPLADGTVVLDGTAVCYTMPLRGK